MRLHVGLLYEPTDSIHGKHQKGLPLRMSEKYQLMHPHHPCAAPECSKRAEIRCSSAQGCFVNIGAVLGSFSREATALRRRLRFAHYKSEIL